jgi:hypothetical protein
LHPPPRRTFRILGQIWKDRTPPRASRRVPSRRIAPHQPSKTGKFALAEFSAVRAYNPRCASLPRPDAKRCSMRQRAARRPTARSATGRPSNRCRRCACGDQARPADALDLLNTLATVADRKAGFRSLGDAWADTTSPHGRLMLIVLTGGLAERAGAVRGLLLDPLGGERVAAGASIDAA